MAIDRATLIVRWPEFTPLPSTQVDAATAAMDRDIAADFGGTALIREDYGLLRACDSLAISPSGRAARLSEPGKITTYAVKVAEYERANLSGNVLF